MVAHLGVGQSAHSPATRDTRGIVPPAEREALAAGLGAELRKLRAKAGLTQARVAGLCGMDVSTVKRFERGALRPTLHALGALARTLAPEGAERLVMGKLVALAGGSARGGAERRRYLKENYAARNALIECDRDLVKMQQLAATLREKGKPVPAHLKQCIDSMPATIATLKARMLPELPELTEPVQQSGSFGGYKLPKSLANLEAYYAARKPPDAAGGGAMPAD